MDTVAEISQCAEAAGIEFELSMKLAYQSEVPDDPELNRRLPCPKTSVGLGMCRGTSIEARERRRQRDA